MVGSRIDIHSLTLDELTGVVNLYPWYAAARVELCRRMENDGAKYFGPYIGANAVRQVIEAVRDVFPLRSCRQTLPSARPKRPCMNNDIGRCMAPCAGKCTEAEYAEMIEKIKANL